MIVTLLSPIKAQPAARKTGRAARQDAVQCGRSTASPWLHPKEQPPVKHSKTKLPDITNLSPRDIYALGSRANQEAADRWHEFKATPGYRRAVKAAEEGSALADALWNRAKERHRATLRWPRNHSEHEMAACGLRIPKVVRLFYGNKWTTVPISKARKLFPRTFWLECVCCGRQKHIDYCWGGKRLPMQWFRCDADCNWKHKLR